MTKMYMMADLVRHHDVDEIAEIFVQHGRVCALEFGKRLTPDQYLRVGMRYELIECLPKYKWSTAYLGMGQGLERFFTLNFKRGWNEAVEAGEVK